MTTKTLKRQNLYFYWRSYQPDSALKDDVVDLSVPDETYPREVASQLKSLATAIGAVGVPERLGMLAFPLQGADSFYIISRAETKLREGRRYVDFKAVLFETDKPFHEAFASMCQIPWGDFEPDKCIVGIEGSAMPIVDSRSMDWTPGLRTKCEPIESGAQDVAEQFLYKYLQASASREEGAYNRAIATGFQKDFFDKYKDKYPILGLIRSQLVAEYFEEYVPPKEPIKLPTQHRDTTVTQGLEELCVELENSNLPVHVWQRIYNKLNDLIDEIKLIEPGYKERWTRSAAKISLVENQIERLYKSLQTLERITTEGTSKLSDIRIKFYSWYENTWKKRQGKAEATYPDEGKLPEQAWYAIMGLVIIALIVAFWYVLGLPPFGDHPVSPAKTQSSNSGAVAQENNENSPKPDADLQLSQLSADQNEPNAGDKVVFTLSLNKSLERDEKFRISSSSRLISVSSPVIGKGGVQEVDFAGKVSAGVKANTEVTVTAKFQGQTQSCQLTVQPKAAIGG
ncbi:MAG TPA: hypothetical protein VGL56_09260 [Fimbriimonadaceae bacterium]